MGFEVLPDWLPWPSTFLTISIPSTTSPEIVINISEYDQDDWKVLITKNNMSIVKPRRDNGCDKKLGAIGVLAGIGH